MNKIKKINYFVFLILFIISSYQNVRAQHQKVNVNFVNASLKDVFKIIEKQSSYRFSYLNSTVDERNDINYSQNNVSVPDLLYTILTPRNLDFKIISNKMIVISAKKAEPVDHLKQISGVVKSHDGEAIIGANVIISGTSKGTITDSEGRFTLNVPNQANIIISYVGYKESIINVSGNIFFTVILNEVFNLLEEVVVVGYGIQQKRDITGSIASVSNETLKRISSNGSLSQSLRGVIPGLNVTVASSSAEQGASIDIRGDKSINASGAPLIILDGIPYNGYLSEIPSDIIKSVEVLKDASSAAIYGSRGANGVIIITTNKGSKGKPVFSVNSKVGLVEIIKKPTVYSAEEFYQKKQEYGATLTTTELENYAAGVNTDWIDIITQTGRQQEHTVSISGGGDKNTYFFSGNLLETVGVAKNDEFRRYSLKYNNDIDLTSWLKFGSNNTLTLLNRDGITASFGEAFFMNPLLKPYNEDGTILFRPWPEDPVMKNPLEGLNVQNLNREYRVISNNYFDITIPYIKGLNYKLNTGVNFDYTNVESYYGMNNTVLGFDSKGLSRVKNGSETGWIVENILSYKKDFNNHSLFFTGLLSFEKNENKFRQLDSKGFTSDYLTTYQESTAQTLYPGSGYSTTSLISQMARINYSYLKRYLITATVRRDGFSAFGADTKYGVFPSVALGYNISEENFMKNNWLDQLKLRASWGKNGNQAISPYSTLARMGVYNYLGGANANVTSPGFIPSALGNPGLGWETTTTTNIGVDFSLLKGTLSGSLELFQSQVTDLLLKRKISSMLGIPGGTVWENIGETENKGYEFALKYTPISHKTLEWVLDFNISASKNKIVKLYSDGKDDIVNKWFLGKPIKVYYGYAKEGIWQEGDDIANSADPLKKPGDVKIKDVNNDNQITPEDRKIQGSYYPDYRANLTSYLRYQNFSLSMMFNAVVGIKKPDDLGDPALTWEYRRNNGAYRNFWTSENPSNEFPANRPNVNYPAA